MQVLEQGFKTSNQRFQLLLDPVLAADGFCFVGQQVLLPTMCYAHLQCVSILHLETDQSVDPVLTADGFCIEASVINSASV